MGKKIGFKDKNGKDLEVNQIVKTYDRTGKKWLGQIVPVSHRHYKGEGIKYAFHANYDTWINYQEYASELEILPREL